MLPLWDLSVVAKNMVDEEPGTICGMSAVCPSLQDNGFHSVSQLKGG